jgi:hypothetical protein
MLPFDGCFAATIVVGGDSPGHMCVITEAYNNSNTRGTRPMTLRKEYRWKT